MCATLALSATSRHTRRQRALVKQRAPRHTRAMLAVAPSETSHQPRRLGRNIARCEPTRLDFVARSEDVRRLLVVVRGAVGRAGVAGPPAGRRVVRVVRAGLIAAVDVVAARRERVCGRGGELNNPETEIRGGGKTDARTLTAAMPSLVMAVGRQIADLLNRPHEESLLRRQTHSHSRHSARSP